MIDRKIRARAYVELNLSNLGAIPHCVRPRLFQPMNRGTESSPPGSMGLGLYIVRRLVEAHAGRVEVLSEGQRTTLRCGSRARTPETARLICGARPRPVRALGAHPRRALEPPARGMSLASLRRVAALEQVSARRRAAR